MTNSSNKEVAELIVHHDFTSDGKIQYEASLEWITYEARKYPGNMGVTIIHPEDESRKYIIVFRFSSSDYLYNWLTSQTRGQFIEKIRPMLTKEEEVEVRTGIEYSPKPEDAEKLQARPFKQFLITLSVIFPLTVLMPLAINPFFQIFPWLERPVINQFFMATIIVYLMVYLIMPIYTRLVEKWLFD